MLLLFLATLSSSVASFSFAISLNWSRRKLSAFFLMQNFQRGVEHQEISSCVCMCVKQNGNLLPFQLESGSGPLVMKKESKDSKSRPLDKLRQAICHERD